jgi:uncharacterized protein
LPLGFLALAAGTLLLSGLQLGWLEAKDGKQVALIIIAFVFPLQALASVFGFLARDVVADTAMGLLAGIWLAIGLVLLVSPAGSTSDALGLFLLVAGPAMLVPAAASFSGKLVPSAVLTTTALRLITTGLYELTGSGTWRDVAGVLGLALCALAIYTALAMALEDARRETILPLGRRRLGRSSIEGSFEEQLTHVERESGVREQL